jgi:hypothetical protein
MNLKTNNVLVAMLMVCVSCHSVAFAQSSSLDRAVTEQQKKTDESLRILDETLKDVKNSGVLSDNPARVYIFATDAMSKEDVDKIIAETKKLSLKNGKFVVLPKPTKITIQVTTAGPNQLRFFNTNDRTEAEQLSKQLEDFIPNLKVIDLSDDLSARRVRPRHYELWIRAPL